MITYDELVEKLETGKSYKYKELCELLNEELTAGGKQRILQLNEWGRFFDFRSVGRALYLVKEIYECPKIKVTNSKYGDMDNILLSYFPWWSRS